MMLTEFRGYTKKRNSAFFSVPTEFRKHHGVYTQVMLATLQPTTGQPQFLTQVKVHHEIRKDNKDQRSFLAVDGSDSSPPLAFTGKASISEKSTNREVLVAT